MREKIIKRVLIRTNEIILGKVDITVIVQYENGEVDIERKLFMGTGDTLELTIDKNKTKTKKNINFIECR